MSKYVFAAEIGDGKVSAAIVSRDGGIVARGAEPLTSPVSATLLDQITRLACDLSKKAGGKPLAAALAAVGAASGDGTITLDELPEAKPIAIADKLQRKLGVNVRLESDRAAAIAGECWKGAAKGSSDAIVLILGNNIRAGVMSGGRVLVGAHRRAGAAGWMAVSEADGFEVRKFGGLEAFASGPGIVRAAKNAVEAGFGGSLAEYDPDLFTAEDIAELARRGDVTARQIYRRAGKQLGLAVANLVSLFDPEVVIVTGTLTTASDLFWPDLLEIATVRSQPGVARQVRICLSEMHGDAVLLGAAKLAWDLLPAKPAGKKPRKPRSRARR